MVGCGGLGSPASQALMRSRALKRITLVDDDTVDVTNLHRQTLYRDEDVGQDKVSRAQARLQADHPESATEVVARRTRMRPDTARELLLDQDLVLEGADNFATKFLTADAARLEGVPVAHAGAVRWAAWAMLSPGHADQGPCLRCVFEDIPGRDGGPPETCATAGVVGPVVGVAAALQSALALAHVQGDPRAAGALFHYDALSGRLRRFRAQPRSTCPLCSGAIQDLRMERYVAA